ncbi:MAG: AsnC family protein [Rhodospirillaceae bacterium]
MTRAVTDPRDLALIAALRDGLPLCATPYRALGAGLGMSEGEVLGRLRALCDSGVIRRFGAVVRHHEAGYAANAMIVFAPAEATIPALGKALADEDAVTLCYRRAPSLPDWPYTLYCMIHGRSREVVLAEIDAIVARHGLADVPRQVLFSRRRFKQTAGRYGRAVGEGVRLVGEAL